MIDLHWVVKESTNVANALGYNTHNKFMRKYSEKHFNLTEDAEIALTITPPDLFDRVPGKINVLFTMWESLEVPNHFVRGLDRADVIVVPSRFCKDLFRKYTDKPIYVCFEGVEPEKYPYHKRDLNGRFRFLWVGAPNPRKGYPFVLEAIKVFEGNPNVEIYLKTTVPKISVLQSFKNIWRYKKEILFGQTDDAKKKRKSVKSILRRLPRPTLHNKLQVWGEHKNIFFDTRVLPYEELIALYNSAHCFLLPTMGEGWGLTLCEAMATGCPSIATAVTGCADFFNEKVGYPLDYGIHKIKLREDFGNIEIDSYAPTTQSLVQQMINVMRHYGKALEKGKKASELIRTKFTWTRSAERLKEIIEDVRANREKYIGH